MRAPWVVPILLSMALCSGCSGVPGTEVSAARQATEESAAQQVPDAEEVVGIAEYAGVRFDFGVVSGLSMPSDVRIGDQLVFEQRWDAAGNPELRFLRNETVHEDPKAAQPEPPKSKPANGTTLEGSYSSEVELIFFDRDYEVQAGQTLKPVVPAQSYAWDPDYLGNPKLQIWNGLGSFITNEGFVTAVIMGRENFSEYDKARLRCCDGRWYIEKMYKDEKAREIVDAALDVMEGHPENEWYARKNFERGY